MAGPQSPAFFFSPAPFLNKRFSFQALNAFEDRKYAKSIGLYKRAMAVDPEFTAAYYNLAVAYDSWYSDKSTALKFYEKGQ